MEEERCDFPRCKKFADFGYVYIGRNICWQHWEQLCNASSGSKIERGLLKKIGLVRDKSGVVVKN